MFKKGKTLNTNISKKIVIIGGGLSGLITGILLLKENHDVTIIEKNDFLGGKIKLLSNNNYPFIIYEADKFNEIIQEIGLKNDYLLPFSLQNFNNNINVFKDFLYQNSLDDEAKIKEILDEIKSKKINKKYSSITIKDFLNDIKSKEIKDKLSLVLNNSLSFSSLIEYLKLYFNNNISYLKNTFIDDLVSHYINLGGKYSFKKEVVSFAFDKKNEAKSITFIDKKSMEADYFISSIDPYITLSKLLKNKFKHVLPIIYNDFMNNHFDTRLILMFAINKTFEYNNINVIVDDMKFNTSRVNFVTFKKSLNNKYLYCEIDQNYNDYDYLKILSSKNKLYLENQERVIKDVISIFNDNFKGYKISFKEMISSIDIENKFQSYKGMLMGFKETPKNNKFICECSIKSLKNVFITSPVLLFNGDITCSLISSKQTIKVLKEEMK